MGRFRKRNKCDLPSNIDSLKTAIEEEWNKMSKEFILKVCKSFQKRVDTIIEKKKWRSYWVNLRFDVYHIYQPLRSGRIWHKVNF